MTRTAQSTIAVDGEQVCGNIHREGWVCTRKWQHSGDHHAHASDPLVPEMKWRGGTPNWRRNWSNS